MIHRPLRPLLTLLMLATSSCDDDRPRDADPDISETQTPDVTGEDVSHELDSADGQDVVLHHVRFGDPFRAGGQPEVELTAVAPTPDGMTAYLGSSQGLYRADAPNFTPTLIHELNSEARPIAIASVVVRTNGEIVVLTEGMKIITSTDAGRSWTALAGVPTPAALYEPNLVTNGEAVLWVPGQGPAFLQSRTGEPWLPVTTDRPNTMELHSLDLDAIAFGDNGKLYGNSISFFGPGAYEIDLAHATTWDLPWTRVDGLDEARGYEAFAFVGGKGVTANAEWLFLREGGVWRRTFTTGPAAAGATAPAPARALVAVDGEFIASGDDGLRTSMDGVVWDALADSPQLRDKLAVANTRLFGVAQSFCTSNDSGRTWQYHPGASRTAQSMSVFDGSIVTRFGGELVFSEETLERAYWQRGEDDPISFLIPGPVASLVVADGVLWVATYSAELYSLREPEAPAILADADWGPGEDPNVVRQYFGNPVGLFAARPHPGPITEGYCGLLRFDADKNWWARADHGLPTVVECAGPAIRHLASSDGILFAGTHNEQTYRSADRGASWTLVGEGAAIAAASCGGFLVALTDGGELWRSEDLGETFEVLPLAGLSSASALLSVGGACIVGLNQALSGPTLWVSHDATLFEPLRADFAEPVLALSGSSDTLAVSTLSQGVIRIDVE